MAALTDITGGELDADLGHAGAGPLVVEFYGSNCPACLMVAGVLEELADEPGAAARFAKLNVEDHPEIADRYAIRGVPVLMVFEDGEVARRQIPRPSRNAIRAFIEGPGEG